MHFHYRFEKKKVSASSSLRAVVVDGYVMYDPHPNERRGSDIGLEPLECDGCFDEEIAQDNMKEKGIAEVIDSKGRGG